MIETVAHCEGVSATDLPPLYDVVDPDALDGLCAQSEGQDGGGTLEVRFDYPGYHVSAKNDGEVQLRRAATNGDGVSGP